MGTLYIGLFIRRLDSIVKKKKTTGVVVDRGEAPTREPKKGGNDSGRG